MVKSRSKALRAGLVWPVGRTISLMRKNGYALRLGPRAVVYASGVLEYLAHTMLQGAAEGTTEAGRNRVTPRDLMNGMFDDDDLHRTFRDVHIVGAGVPATAKPIRVAKKKALLAKKLQAKIDARAALEADDDDDDSVSA